MTAPADDLDDALGLVGTVLGGRYELVQLLGVGGMGAVFRARHTHLECIRAVKVLLKAHAGDKNTVRRFHHEARGLSRLHHPNVVSVVDTGESSDGLPFIAMEFLEGEPLSSTLERHGQLPWSIVKHIARQVCNALHAAHEAGIVHRDVKPDNCFRVNDADDPYRIKLLDFGIAKLKADGQNVVTKLTKTGNVLGTYHYMSYEQVCGETCDRQSDVWSTGVMIYELLTGKLPFNGSNMGQIFAAIVQREPVPVSRTSSKANVPSDLDVVLGRAFEKDARYRYPTMLAFLEALESVSESGPTEAVTDVYARGHQVHAFAPTSPHPLSVGPTELRADDVEDAGEGFSGERTDHGALQSVELQDRGTSEGPSALQSSTYKLDDSVITQVASSRHRLSLWKRFTGRRWFQIAVGSSGLALVLGTSWAVVDSYRRSTPLESSERIGTNSIIDKNSVSQKSEAAADDNVTDNLPPSRTVEIGAESTERPENDLGLTGSTSDTGEDLLSPVDPEIQEEPSERKSKRIRSTSAKAASSSKNKRTSLKARVGKELGRLRRLLVSECMGPLPPASTATFKAKFHRAGEVEFVGWDENSRLWHEGSSFERCLKRSLSGFRIQSGDDTDESVTTLITIRN